LALAAHAAATILVDGISERRIDATIQMPSVRPGSVVREYEMRTMPTATGLLSNVNLLTVAEPKGEVLAAWGDKARAYKYCGNAKYGCCNWLIPACSQEAFCAACSHNGTIPDLSQSRNVELWRKIKLAKHRLFYSLLRFHLPLHTRFEDTEGLIFDFPPDNAASGGQASMTGHEEGRITIALAEVDDAEREKRRSAMREPYRTILGHFRHEIGHYYWDRLVRDTVLLEPCRAVFGDDRLDDGEALRPSLRKGRSRKLAGQLCQRLRHFPSVGRFCRNMGSLFPYRRYLGDGSRFRRRYPCDPRHWRRT
jgi:Putative zinc-binding metallo-peptidase/zinc-ribbon domain